MNKRMKQPKKDEFRTLTDKAIKILFKNKTKLPYERLDELKMLFMQFRIKEAQDQKRKLKTA